MHHLCVWKECVWLKYKKRKTEMGNCPFLKVQLHGLKWSVSFLPLTVSHFPPFLSSHHIGCSSTCSFSPSLSIPPSISSSIHPSFLTSFLLLSRPSYPCNSRLTFPCSPADTHEGEERERGNTVQPYIHPACLLSPFGACSSVIT